MRAQQKWEHKYLTDEQRAKEAALQEEAFMSLGGSLVPKHTKRVTEREGEIYQYPNPHRDRARESCPLNAQTRRAVVFPAPSPRPIHLKTAPTRLGVGFCAAFVFRGGSIRRLSGQWPRAPGSGSTPRACFVVYSSCFLMGVFVSGLSP